MIPYKEQRSGAVSPQRTKRYDASTTTLDQYDQGQEWSAAYNPPSQTSPSTVHRHDGYIRPMTPRKPSVDQNIHAIYLGTDDARAQTPSPPPRTSVYNTDECPVIYRSSTTIYTKDKHNYLDGGELRTFSLQSTDDNDFRKKSTTSLHIDISNDHEILPPKRADEYQYYVRAHDKEIIRKDDDEENYVVAYEYAKSPQPQYSHDTRSYSLNRGSRK